MLIRLAKFKDLVEITNIYNQAIPSQKSTGHTEPLKPENQTNWFNNHKPDSFPIFVAESNNQIIGWCSLSPYRESRLAFKHTAEISYYIDFNHHRKGIASKLINYSINQCKSLQLKNLVAFLMEHNTPSVLLLEKYGFKKWGLLPKVATFNGVEYNHVIFGLNIA